MKGALVLRFEDEVWGQEARRRGGRVRSEGEERW